MERVCVGVGRLRLGPPSGKPKTNRNYVLYLEGDEDSAG
jgi:hypothetical protein